MRGIAAKLAVLVLLNVIIGGGYVLLLERVAAAHDNSRLRWQFHRGQVFYQELRCASRAERHLAVGTPGILVHGTSSDHWIQIELVMLVRWTAVGQDDAGSWQFNAKPLRIRAKAFNTCKHVLFPIILSNYDSDCVVASHFRQDPLYFRPLLHSELNLALGPEMRGVLDGTITSNANSDLDSYFDMKIAANIFMTESLFGWMPDGPVEKGCSWSRERKFHETDRDFYASKHRYIYEGSEGSLDTIHADIVAKHVTTNGIMNFLTSSESFGTGVIKFDRQKGRVESYEATGWLNRKISVKITDEPPVDK